MGKRLPRADKRLLMPGGEKQAPARETIVLPGDDRTDVPETAEERKSWEPTVVLQEGVREISATTLAEEHQGMMQVHRELAADPDSEDLGDGFNMWPEPAHVLRGPDGGITSVVPLSEIPGVELSSRDEETIAMAKDSRPTPVPLNREERHKLVSILAGRLWKYYKQLPPTYPGYHPFRDGIPDLPAGSPKNLAPDVRDLYPATDAQIYDWIYKFVGQRATVVNKNKFGAGIQDMALRIE